ncbi:hypothetical protein ACQ4PT_064985 [Festuca glaucescens]
MLEEGYPTAITSCGRYRPGEEHPHAATAPCGAVSGHNGVIQIVINVVDAVRLPQRSGPSTRAPRSDHGVCAVVRSKRACPQGSPPSRTDNPVLAIASCSSLAALISAFHTRRINLIKPVEVHGVVDGKELRELAGEPGLHTTEVLISPVTSRCVNHAVMRELVNKHAEVGFRPDCSAYDGSKILYTLGELNFGSSAFKITLQDKEEDNPHGPGALQRHFDVRIKRSAHVSMKSLYELHDLMPDHVPPAILQALHIVLRELPTEECFPVDSHGTMEPGETVVQYFQKRYGVSIQYKSLNCLQGFNLSPVLSVEAAKPEHAQLALTLLHSNVMAKLGPGRNLDLLVVILPDKNGSLYGDLKRICETDIGLVSQCCLSKHVLRKNKQYLANLALKINVKIGGRNTVLNDAIEKKLPHVGDTPTIFLGATVTHPPPGKRSSPSIASVVASQDWPEVTRYAGLVSSQPGHHEWINNLVELQYDSEKGTVTGGMIREHLISFYQTTGQKPQRIMINGVSKGQYSQVLKNELCAIELACKSLEKDYNPTITYVVVQKRHRTRLFPADYRDKPSDSTGNLWPG